LPRHLVVGNGRLLINFDGEGNLRDLYYPHVGMENHLEGNRCRLGVWVEGKFSWFGKGWERSLLYRDETLVTEIRGTCRDLGLELVLSDGVHYAKDLYLRKVLLRNLTSRAREVRLFFSHPFRLYGVNVGDTACYDPAVGAIIHYKKKRYLLVNGIAGGGRIHQFATGTAGVGEALGTWKDAEDGLLSNHPIAQGSVDSTIGLRTFLPGNGEDVAYCWIAAGKDFLTVRRLNREVLRRSPERFLKEVDAYHRSWLSAGMTRSGLDYTGLPTDVMKLFQRSLLILRTQIDEGGAIIAANDSDVIQFNRDHYSYMWPRDGALVAYSLDKAGYPLLSRRFFKFCSRLMSERGYFFHKYNPDGTLASSWHPWMGEDGKGQLPIQEDGTAFILFSLWHHYWQFRDIEFIKTLYEPLIKKAVEFLIEYRDEVYKLPLPSYDLWEERRGIYTFTSSAVYAGIAAAWNFAQLFGDWEEAERYKKAALEVRDGVWNILYDEKLGRFLRGIQIDKSGRMTKDATLDSSLYSLFYFCALPADDPRVRRTMEALRKRLWCKTPVGGMARYENDRYHQISGDIEKVPGNPWFICTLWLAQWYIAVAKKPRDLTRALEILQWTATRALPSGVLAEQLHPYTSGPLSVSPLTWSHATYIITVLEYLEKARELTSSKRPPPRR
jgi:GH15 family glucan-1,4-alpha-glucosidase